MAYINSIPPAAENTTESYIFSINENGQTYPSTIPVIIKEKSVIIPKSVVDNLHVKYTTDQVNNDQVDLKKIKDVKVELDESALLLNITVPESWLPIQHLEVKDNWKEKYFSSNVTPGMVIDYSLYSEQPYHASYLSSWFNARYYSNYGYLNTSGQYSHTMNGGQSDSKFHRFNTSLVVNNRENEQKIILGDFTSSSSNGFSGAYLGGIQLRKDYSLRPDIITYPSINLTGSAATPSTLDFFVNGYKKTSTKIGSGPYVINNIPFINGDGTITVVTTDQTGQRTQTTIPFDIQSDMLKPGLSDYEFSLGGLRYNYGTDEDKYRNLALISSWRYGLLNNLTTVSHLEQTGNLLGMAGGIQYNMGVFGRTDLTISGSNTPMSHGFNEYLSYSKSLQSGNLNISQSYSGKGYQSITNYGNQPRDYAVSSVQIFYSQSLGANLGSLGTGVIAQRISDQPKQVIANISYDKSFFNDISLSLSYSREFAVTNDNSFVISLSVPLGQHTLVGQQWQKTRHANDFITSMSHSSQTPLGIDWDLSTSVAGYNNMVDGYKKMHDNYKNMSATWKANHSTLSGGAYGYQNLTTWQSLTGSVVLMDNSLFFARELGSAFAKVDTNGVAGVPYYLNGSPQGVTDSRGVGFISDITPYQDNEISIAANKLPDNMVATESSEKVFIPELAGYSINFPMKNMSNRLIVRIKSSQGEAAPLNSAILDETNKTVGWTGYSGIAEIPAASGLERHRYRVAYSNNRYCQFTDQAIKNSGIHTVQCTFMR